jgi:hypothetical protein
VIHDYFDYQPTKEKAVKKRRDNAERQRRYRERQQEAERRSGNNADSNASRNASVTRPKSKSSPEGTRTWTDTGSQSSSRRNAPAWADDDDSIDLGIVELLAELTNREVSILDATQIRQRILGSRQIKSSRAAYVAAAIHDNPNKFLPAQQSDEPDGPYLRVVPDRLAWCGHCDSDDYRWLLLADGRWTKCPACNSDAKDPFASREVS